MRGDRLFGVLKALLVTFLWSSSYVLVKVGLQEIGPLTIVAYWYTVAKVPAMALVFLGALIVKLRK